jgi:hypothetical protein
MNSVFIPIIIHEQIMQFSKTGDAVSKEYIYHTTTMQDMP